MSEFSRTDIDLMALQVVVTALAKKLEGDKEFMDEAMNNTRRFQEDLDTRSAKERLNTAVQVLITG